jgi:hypothetical protein
MTLVVSKIWEMCFAGFGTVVCFAGTVAGPIVPALRCGANEYSIALG